MMVCINNHLAQEKFFDVRNVPNSYVNTPNIVRLYICNHGIISLHTRNDKKEEFKFLQMFIVRI